jgi:midasin (ATPase involved in ribosome maturation)
VYIPELGKEFACPPTFRIFAAQNPLVQGGGRKGLPKSFLNRFTKVYIEALTSDDLFSIVSAQVRDWIDDLHHVSSTSFSTFPLFDHETAVHFNPYRYCGENDSL